MQPLPRRRRLACAMATRSGRRTRRRASGALHGRERGETMKATELLGTRASNGKLGEPAPDDETLNAIVRDALRAPDHAALRPWRIFTVRGEARERLGDLFAEIEGGEGEALERARR